MKVLIVDDSLLIIKKTKELLSPLTVVTEITAVTSFNEAIVAIDKVAPHVVILDIRLKDGNGIELLQIFKEKYPQIRVIMFTNESGEEYELTCKKLGADYFITKSEFDKLAAILSSITPK